MERIFLNIISISVFSSIIVFILILLMPLIKKNLKVKWRYYIWIIIAFRLIIPYNFYPPNKNININVKSEELTIPLQNNFTKEHTVDTDYASESNIKDDDIVLRNAEISKPEKLNFLIIFEIIWSIGVFLFLVVQLISYIKFKLQIKSSAVYEVSDNTIEALESIGKEMNIKRLPKLWSSDYIISPIITGFIKPILYLPNKVFSEEEIMLIFRHELIHCKRKDLHYKLIMMLANAIHWFNPVIYYLNYIAGKDLELSCDEEVINTMDYKDRAIYGEVILKSLPQKNTELPFISMQFGSGKKEVKMRLDNLFDFRNKRKGVPLIIIVSVFVIFFTGAISLSTAKIEASTQNYLSTQEKEKPKSLDVSIDKMPVNTAICIGEINPTLGKVFNINVKTQTGSDYFVVLSENAEINTASVKPSINGEGVLSEWSLMVGSVGTKAQFISHVDSAGLSGNYYVFIISGDQELTSVSGSVYLSDSVNDFTKNNTLNTEQENKDEIDYFSVDIDKLSAGEVVCLGEIKLSENQTLVYDVATKSNEPIFVALYNNPDIKHNNGLGWLVYTASNKNVQIKWSTDEIREYHDLNKAYYVYVGSVDSEVMDITGSVYLTNKKRDEIVLDYSSDKRANDNLYNQALPSSPNILIPISIDKLSENEVICVGEIKLGKGKTIIYDVKSKIGSNLNLFVALDKRPDRTDKKDEDWRMYSSGNIIEYKWAVDSYADILDFNETYYVYVGSNNGDLTDISGFIYSADIDKKTTNQVTPENKPVSDRKFEEDIKNFKPHGIAFDSEKNEMYYNGERVRLFVSFQKDNSFYICWQNPYAETGLFIEGLIDDSKNAIGAKFLNSSQGIEIINDMNEISDSPVYFEENKTSDSSKEIKMYTLSGTSTITIADTKLVASDKDEIKENLPSNIKKWIANSDGTGFHLLKTKEGDIHTSYLYYDIDVKLPWTIDFINGELRLNLYDDKNTAKGGEGYHIIKLESSEYYPPKVYLNDNEILYLTEDLSNAPRQ